MLVLGMLRVADGMLTLGRVIEGTFGSRLVEGTDRIGTEIEGTVMLAETAGIETPGIEAEGMLSGGAVRLPGSMFETENDGNVVLVGRDRLGPKGTLKLGAEGTLKLGAEGTLKLGPLGSVRLGADSEGAGVQNGRIRRQGGRQTSRNARQA